QDRAEEIGQVVPGVDGRHAEPGGGDQAPPALAGRTDRAEAPPPPRQQAVRSAAPPRVAHRRGAQRGTGTSWAIARMTRSASSAVPTAPGVLRITRWARTGTAKAFRSSGTRYSRPSARAWARAARSRASDPRGLTPRARTAEARVAATSAMR